MAFLKIFWTIIVASFVCSICYVDADTVLSGSIVDFECDSQTMDGVLYKPMFEKLDNGYWVTLFTGPDPRPETDLSKWRVNSTDSGFRYRLRFASLIDAGIYRCFNVKTTTLPVGVVDSSLHCDKVPTGVIPTNSSWRPSCGVVVAGPAGEPSIQWVVGTYDNVKRNLTSEEGVSDAVFGAAGKIPGNASFVASILSEDFYEDLHGRTISCFLAGDAFDEFTRPSCVLGKLDVGFDVKVDSVRKYAEGTFVNYELVLVGNPMPLPQLVDVRASEIHCAVESSVLGGEGSPVVVLVRARGVVSVDILYNDFVIKRIIFTGEREVVENDDDAVIAGAIGAISVVFLFVAAVFVLRRKMIGKGEDVEKGNEEEEEEEEEEEDEKEEEKEKPKESRFPELEEGYLKSKILELEEEELRMIDDSINEKADDGQPDNLKV